MLWGLTCGRCRAENIAGKNMPGIWYAFSHNVSKRIRQRDVVVDDASARAMTQLEQGGSFKTPDREVGPTSATDIAET